MDKVKVCRNGNLKADTEREGEGEEDQQQGDAGEGPATQANTSIVLISCKVYTIGVQAGLCLSQVTTSTHLPSTDIFLALCAEGVRGGSLYDWDIRDARRNSPSPTLSMAQTQLEHRQLRCHLSLPAKDPRRPDHVPASCVQVPAQMTAMSEIQSLQAWPVWTRPGQVCNIKLRVWTE